MKKNFPENRSSIEWPTLGLITTNYVAWFICLALFDIAPLLSAIGMSLVLALQSSLSHELIHGHPTRSNTINMSLGLIPLTLFYPIHLFKETHLKHHDNDKLTLPGVDPESFFHCPVKWTEKCQIGRWYAWVNMTLVGRLFFSLPNTIAQVARYAGRDFRYGSWQQRGFWLTHFFLLYLLCTAIQTLNWMPLHVYFLCAWVGHGIIAFRAFFEHRPAHLPSHRIVVVASNWFFRLIYLGNNYHAVHHQYPHLPWYQIPAVYKDSKSETLNSNDHFYYKGYFQWLSYLFRPIQSPIHPGVPDLDPRN